MLQKNYATSLPATHHIFMIYLYKQLCQCYEYVGYLKSYSGQNSYIFLEGGVYLLYLIGQIKTSIVLTGKIKN